MSFKIPVKIFFPVILLLGVIFCSCKESRGGKYFEGRIDYDLYEANNYKWKYGRDCVIVERPETETVYCGPGGQIDIRERDISMFNAMDREAYRINVYKDHIYCHKDYRHREFRENYTKLDSSGFVAGFKCSITKSGEKSGSDGTYFSVSDSLPVNPGNSAYSLRETDSVFKRVVLREDHIWGWTRKIRVARKVTAMMTDTVFARYHAMIENDESMIRHKRRLFQRNYLFPGIIVLLFLAPATYMWRAKKGWLAFLLSLSISIALIYFFDQLRDEEIAREPKRWLNLFRGLGANIKFTFRSLAVLLGHVTFTIIYVVIMRKSKKQNQ